MLSSEDRNKLRELLDQHFSISELQDLCFELGIDHEDLPRSSQNEMVIGLLTYCERHSLTPDLIERCKRLRPLVNWPTVQPYSQPIGSHGKEIGGFKIPTIPTSVWVAIVTGVLGLLGVLGKAYFDYRTALATESQGTKQPATPQSPTVIASSPTIIVSTPTVSNPTPSLSPGSEIIEDFEYSDENNLVQFYTINAPGNELILTLEGDPYAVSGANALAMRYRIKSGDPTADYAGIERTDMAPQDWRRFSQVCLSVRNNSFKGHLVFQFKEQQGEVWKYQIPLDGVGSEEICTPFNDFSRAEFSDEQNGVVDLGVIDKFAFYLGGGGMTEGIFYLDKVELRP